MIDIEEIIPPWRQVLRQRVLQQEQRHRPRYILRIFISYNINIDRRSASNVLNIDLFARKIVTAVISHVTLVMRMKIKSFLVILVSLPGHVLERAFSLNQEDPRIALSLRCCIPHISGSHQQYRQ